MSSVYLEKLLDASAPGGTPKNGPAKEVRELDEITIQVQGVIASDIVKIQGTNDDLTKIAAASANWDDLEFEGSPNLTADGIYLTESAPAGIRAVHQADVGGGTITVIMKGLRLE